MEAAAAQKGDLSDEGPSLIECDEERHWSFLIRLLLFCTYLFGGVLVALGPAAELGHDDVVAAGGGVLLSRGGLGVLPRGLPSALGGSTVGLCMQALVRAFP